MYVYVFVCMDVFYVAASYSFYDFMICCYKLNKYTYIAPDLGIDYSGRCTRTCNYLNKHVTKTKSPIKVHINRLIKA